MPVLSTLGGLSASTSKITPITTFMVYNETNFYSITNSNRNYLVFTFLNGTSRNLSLLGKLYYQFGPPTLNSWHYLLGGGGGGGAWGGTNSSNGGGGGGGGININNFNSPTTMVQSAFPNSDFGPIDNVRAGGPGISSEYWGGTAIQGGNGNSGNAGSGGACPTGFSGGAGASSNTYRGGGGGGGLGGSGGTGGNSSTATTSIGGSPGATSAPSAWFISPGFVSGGGRGGRGTSQSTSTAPGSGGRGGDSVNNSNSGRVGYGGIVCIAIDITDVGPYRVLQGSTFNPWL